MVLKLAILLADFEKIATIFFFERTSYGVDLLEMMLTGSIITLYTTVTYQSFRKLAILCVQLANVPV